MPGNTSRPSFAVLSAAALMVAFAALPTADALACKLCLDVVDAIENGGSDTACSTACSELADFPLCTDLCGYLLNDLVTFIKDKIASECLRDIFCSLIIAHVCHARGHWRPERS